MSKAEAAEIQKALGAVRERSSPSVPSLRNDPWPGRIRIILNDAIERDYCATCDGVRAFLKEVWGYAGAYTTVGKYLTTYERDLWMRANGRARRDR